MYSIKVLPTTKYPEPLYNSPIVTAFEYGHYETKYSSSKFLHVLFQLLSPVFHVTHSNPHIRRYESQIR